MAPSAALQSRINAFEALESENGGRHKLKGSVQLAPLHATPKVVEYRPDQSILDSDSTSPTADSLFVIPPIQPVPSPSRPSSPIALGRKSSLINFNELSSPRLKPISANGTGSTTSSSASDSPNKPQLPPRVSPRLPPLPPRKPSITSLKTIPTTTPPPLPQRHTSSPISSTSKPSHTSSLLLPSDTHTYPPTLPKPSASPGFQSRHVPSSSTSSFHSVSLSSDSGGDARDSVETRDSLDGSYEAVSSTAATSPTSHEWEHDLFTTPKLSQRTWQKQNVSPPIMGNPPPASRRPAPPPPQRRVIKPDVTAPASLPHDSPTLIPSNVRQRYHALFERNLPQNQGKGHSSGWRGLSVDLLTNGEKPVFGGDIPNADRLEGIVIKQIWSCSKLPRKRLQQIWNECDSGRLGSLDRDAFVKGMWLIDEELRLGQSRVRPSSLKAVAISYAPRAPPPPLRKPNFLR